MTKCLSAHVPVELEIHRTGHLMYHLNLQLIEAMMITSRVFSTVLKHSIQKMELIVVQHLEENSGLTDSGVTLQVFIKVEMWHQLVL